MDAGAFDDAPRNKGDCMNNKTQQRFDKSIREAVVAEDSRREQLSREAKLKAVSKARQLLPATERLLISGYNRGQKLTKEQIDYLRAARSDYRRTLGLTMDREMVDIPTKTEGVTI